MYWEEGKKSGRGEELISREVSLDGLRFESKRLHPLGSILETEVYLPGRVTPIECQLRVTHVEPLQTRDEYLLGAVYAKIDANDGMEIVGMLDRLDLYMLLENALAAGASDVHLTVGMPPMIRCNGKLMPFPGIEPLADGEIPAMLFPLLNSDQINHFEQGREFDFAFSPTPESRFRVNLHWQRGFAEAALRSVPTQVKSFEELQLPAKSLQLFCRQKAGLVLICGTTGAGKTTTMSAMVNYINSHHHYMVVTVEDPVEYLHRNQSSVVKQREIGSDTLSYADALRHSLRQDPDVICVGEILDRDCLSAAMKAAETGHLVISTIHAPNTTQALQRAISLFPPEHCANVSSQLASSLIGIIYQVLLPTKSGGRVPATEVMINNNAIRNMIRESRFSGMNNVLQTSRQQGMYTLKSSIDNLIENDTIDPEILKTMKQLEYTG